MRLMSEITEYEQRIRTAMQRISQGLEALPVPAPLPEPEENQGQQEALEEAMASLEEERLANAQLAERLKLLKERHDTEIAELRAEQAQQETQQREALALMVQDMQKLRESAQALSEANAALTANAPEATPGDVEAGLRAELDALRAARALELSESSAILAAMAPLITRPAAQENA